MKIYPKFIIFAASILALSACKQPIPKTDEPAQNTEEVQDTQEVREEGYSDQYKKDETQAEMDKKTDMGKTDMSDEPDTTEPEMQDGEKPEEPK